MQDAKRSYREMLWVFLILFAIYVLRDVPGALAPPLFNEDGPNMLDFYNAGHEPARIFRFYGGYISVGPNLIGYLLGFLPISLAVYALYWVPMAIAAVTFAILCHPGFALPGLTRKDRLFTALLLGVFPAANMALMTNTTFALWHLAILLVLMCLLWAPKTRAGAVTGSLFGVIAATSHPVSIILMPVLLWRIWNAETAMERWVFAPVALIVPVYILLGVTPDGSGGSPEIIGSLWEAVRLFFERGIFETLFSTRIRSIFLFRGLEPLIWVFGIVLIGILWWLAERQARVLIAVLLILGFGNSLFSALARDMPINSTWGHRYGYFTGVLFLLAAAISLLPAWQRWSPARPGYKHAVLAALAGMAVVSLIFKQPYYRNNPIKGAEVAQLLAVLEQTPEPYCLRVEREEWSFAVRSTNDVECITLPKLQR